MCICIKYLKKQYKRHKCAWVDGDTRHRQCTIQGYQAKFRKQVPYKVACGCYASLHVSAIQVGVHKATTQKLPCKMYCAILSPKDCMSRSYQIRLVVLKIVTPRVLFINDVPEPSCYIRQ